MNSLLQKLRRLILPPRPDPARSRRIAEGRLMIGCLVAFGIFITIGVRIVGLADASASTRLAKSAAAITTERGRILDRKGRLLAGNLPITVLHADPSEIMDARDAAAKLAPLLNQHCRPSVMRKFCNWGFRVFILLRARFAFIHANMLPRIFLAMSILIISALPESKNQ